MDHQHDPKSGRTRYWGRIELKVYSRSSHFGTPDVEWLKAQAYGRAYGEFCGDWTRLGINMPVDMHGVVESAQMQIEADLKT